MSETARNTEEYSRAFFVGWRLAQLYARPVHIAEVPAFATDKEHGLPEIPEKLTEQQQARLIWVGLQTDIGTLPGGTAPEISDATTTVRVHLQNANYDKVAISTGIADLFKLTLTNVYVINPHLAKALVAGEQLAELVFTPADQDSPFAVLEARLSKDNVKRTCSLLAELQSAFPLRATVAVDGSLVYWQRWVEANGSGGDAGKQALLRQGELWRSLLTGETRADDLLGLGDYRQAFVDYTHQVALLARKYPLVWLLVGMLLAGAGAGIWAIITYAPTGAAVIAGVIAAAAGALGVTWKTVAVTLGKASTLLERPMVEDGLKEAVKSAAFIPPVYKTPALITQLRKEGHVESGKRPRPSLLRVFTGRSSAKPATLNASPGNSAAAPKVIDAPAASAPET
jgi:hypothetical protein